MTRNVTIKFISYKELLKIVVFDATIPYRSVLPESVSPPRLYCTLNRLTFLRKDIRQTNS